MSRFSIFDFRFSICSWCGALAVVMGILVASCGDKNGPPPVYRLSDLELQHRVYADVKAVGRYRGGLTAILDYAGTVDLLADGAGAGNALPRRESKEELWAVWNGILDYNLALDSIRQYHSSYYLVGGKRLRNDSFLVFHAAFLAQYAAALEFIAMASKCSACDALLDEPVPELGLPGGAWAAYRYRYLNVGMATQFAALEVVHESLDPQDFLGIAEGIKADSALVWKMGEGQGEKMTFENARAVTEELGKAAWFPIQAGVSEWMGDTKVWRVNASLVSAEQIEELAPQLLPGDILLERREWYLSNVGLPGFWPHAALYVGTSEEREAFFGNDEETREWVVEQGEASGRLDGLLQSRYPEAWEKSVATDSTGHRPRIVEAMSEGVSFTTLEHSADCDSLAVLRPKLPPKEKARAVLEAFHYSGRPYDFDFDFLTDSSLVCTELVYKCYERSTDFAGLEFPVVSLLGRKVTPANAIARQLDETWGTSLQQYDLILFLDGHEKEGRAAIAGIDEFRQSWRRPKWHVLK